MHSLERMLTLFPKQPSLAERAVTNPGLLQQSRCYTENWNSKFFDSTRVIRCCRRF